jgi:transcriptional regulator with XRE-family HTH domain
MAFLIREKRDALGITMTELAARIPMDLGKLSRLERGQMKTKVEDLQLIALALGCKTTDLIEDINTAPVGVEGE